MAINHLRLPSGGQAPPPHTHTHPGALYSWGAGQCGRFGHGDESKQLLPKRVDALSSVKASVDAEHLASGAGEARLAELEAAAEQARAASSLAATIESSDIARLRVSLVAARAASVDAEHLASGEARLVELEAAAEQARAASSAAREAA